MKKMSRKTLFDCRNRLFRKRGTSHPRDSSMNSVSKIEDGQLKKQKLDIFECILRWATVLLTIIVVLGVIVSLACVVIFVVNSIVFGEINIALLGYIYKIIKLLCLMGTACIVKIVVKICRFFTNESEK